MSDDLSNETSATPNAGSGERPAYRSAGALALGLGLLLGGVVVLFLVGPLGAALGGSGMSLVGILGTVTVIAGIIQVVIGVYQCADNIDRATKALLDRP